MQRLRIAVVGVGHLGKEHARILSTLPEVDLVGVADTNAEQVRAIADRCQTRGYTDHRFLLSLVDAAVIAVPTTYHHAVARDFLSRGVSLLVEKPLASTLAEAEALVTLAEQHQAVLQVGHIERFNPAFEELQRRTLRPKFVECERCGPFSGRSLDIGVVLDLMIHDLDLLCALVRAPVEAVEALGVSLFGVHEDIAHARLRFANGCVANVSASRASTTPIRKMRAWGPEGYACVDFAKRDLTLVQASDDLRRLGKMHAKLDAIELTALKTQLFERYLLPLHLDCPGGDQLTRELQDFVRCVAHQQLPRVSGEEGREAIALATRVLESLRSHCWEAPDIGPTGPLDLPAEMGPLFQLPARVAAA